jgi:hypothetical protein
MKLIKRRVLICLAIIIAVTIVSDGRLLGQSGALKSSSASTGSERQWSIQVDQVEPGNTELAYSFQVATYESLLEEVNKTHRFKHVFRQDDRQASDAADLLVLKTTVLKYTAGSETRRAVTTFSGATKLGVRTQLVTRDGTIVLDRTVDGKVRFFGSNLRATHNLARNIAKAIVRSPLRDSEQAAAINARANVTANSLQERQ